MAFGASSLSDNMLALRGLAAFALVLGHLLLGAPYQMGFAQAEDAPLLSQLMLFYFLVVEIFLLLSGCLLTLRYWDIFTRETPARQIDRFIWGRIRRIYPLHLLTTLWIGCYALANIPHPISSGLEDTIFSHWDITLLLNLLLMQGWGIVPVASWNEPSWTLSVLFMLYILFPNLVIGLKRLPQSPRLYLGLLAGLLPGYVALRQMVDFGSHSDGAGGLVRGLVFFLCGIALARLYQLGWRAHWRWDGLLGASLLALPLLAALWHLGGAFDMVLFHAALCVLLYAALRAQGRVAGILAAAPARWLGGISYSLYLTHYPAMLGLGYGFGEELAALAETGVAGKTAAYAAALIAVLAIGWAVDRAVERPIAVLMRKK